MKKSTFIDRLMLAAVVLLSMAACGIGRPAQQPQKEIFVLGAEPPEQGFPASRRSSGCSLRVTTPVSAAGLNTARMVYSTEPKRLEYFAYHEWAAPPSKMIASLLEKRLDASGMFSFVVTDTPDIRADLRLDSKLLILQQNFENGGSNVQLAVKVILAEPGTRTLVATDSFGYKETAASADPESGVDAAHRATGQFVIDLEEFIEDALADTKCSDTN